MPCPPPSSSGVELSPIVSQCSGGQDHLQSVIINKPNTTTSEVKEKQEETSNQPVNSELAELVEISLPIQEKVGRIHHQLYPSPTHMVTGHQRTSFPSVKGMEHETTDTLKKGAEQGEGILNEAPGPLGTIDKTAMVKTPLSGVWTVGERTCSNLSITESSQSLQRHVSFHQDEEDVKHKPRPLPPIGSTVSPHDSHLANVGRRLPPLTHGQLDALSLCSGSSQSQLYSHLGSTYSLPDPRYSSPPPDVQKMSISRRDSRKKKKVARVFKSSGDIVFTPPQEFSAQSQELPT